MHPSPRLPRPAGSFASLIVALSLALPGGAVAQNIAPRRDGTTSITVMVRADSTAAGRPVESAIVQGGSTGGVSSSRIASRTDARGIATLELAVGANTVVATKLGHRPDSIVLVVRVGVDTTVTIVLPERAVDVGAVIISATRGERRVEDTPIRVEIIDEEEIAEKVAMSPGDIAMMLNETSGLRVQATNPSLGGANVRIQGLRGRYTLLLADGLPLYGGQSGGLGLLQIPPVDLARVEIIKGTASALYGSSALGGVIDLVSRRPGEKAERTLLVNGTSRGGADAVFFGASPLGERMGVTLLAGAHRQRQNDLDADGWTDMPGFERVVVRPRLYLDNGAGNTAFLTGGFTAEDRTGGTLDAAVTPDGSPYDESLRTRRADVGALARWTAPSDGALFGMSALHSALFTLRGSAVEQRHAHRFGRVQEDDRHRTWFGEAALAVPRGRVTYVAGAAFQHDSYRADSVRGFDYSYAIPALFGQLDVDAQSWLSLSASVRADQHSEYGLFVNPRVSLLLRAPEGVLAGWTARASAGTGDFAPTPFVEETEVTGLTPLSSVVPLQAEHATSGSIDIGGPLSTSFGAVELNGTLFGSRVRYPLHTLSIARFSPFDGSATDLPIAIVNAPQPTRTWGTELLARLVHPFGSDEDSPALRVTGTYTFLRATECDLDGSYFYDGSTNPPSGPCVRQLVALTPKHSAGIVATVEQEGKSRIGLELYYTGRQRLEENPYRSESRPYLIVGLMGERAVETRAGVARFFLNLENLTDVRQTRYDPLLLPSRGAGGRWTTDAWTDLSGFTVNGGVRFGW